MGERSACASFSADSGSRAMSDSECLAFGAQVDSMRRATADSGFQERRGRQQLSRHVSADYYAQRLGRGPVELSYVILWRGQPGRGRSTASLGLSATSGSNRLGGRRQSSSVEFAGGNIEWTFEETTHVLHMLGRDIALTTDNVVLVDRVDGVGGPPVVVGTARVSRQLPSFEFDLRRLVRGSPEIDRFDR